MAETGVLCSRTPVSLWLEDEERIQVLLGHWEVMSTAVRGLVLPTRDTMASLI